jgi:hypothetical protein
MNRRVACGSNFLFVLGLALWFGCLAVSAIDVRANPAFETRFAGFDHGLISSQNSTPAVNG